MADYNSIHSGSTIDTTITNADAGNIGKDSTSVFTGNLDTILINSTTYVGSSASNNPNGAAGTCNTSMSDATSAATQLYTEIGSNKTYFRRRVGGAWQPWQEIYHTGNTGSVKFNSLQPDGSANEIVLDPSDSTGLVGSGRSSTASSLHFAFFNPNGLVGRIDTDANSTMYATSSDNRLKTVVGKPTDADIDAKFNDIYDTFTLFNWKNGGNNQPVWGFLAHDVIDKGLDFGSEGEGPRNLNIGDKYEDAVLDQEGNEIEPAKYVSPAGVDQSKVVPYLVAKIEQLERRLKALEA